MVDLFQAFLLALVQGLTEFLPISSSAHLVLVPRVLGWADQGLAFDVAVHIGTSVAVIHAFREELASILASFTRWGREEGGKGAGEKPEGRTLAVLLILGTLPICVAGLLVKDLVPSWRTLPVLASTTLGFGLLLGWADAGAPCRRGFASLSIRDALWIGIAQCFAILPGTSRSGATITAGLMLGLDRRASARFSFLLAIPTILIAGGMAAKDLFSSKTEIEWIPVLVGVAVSALTARLCIHWFLAWVARIGMRPFVIYRVLLAAVLFGFVFLGS